MSDRGGSTPANARDLMRMAVTGSKGVVWSDVDVRVEEPRPGGYRKGDTVRTVTSVIPMPLTNEVAVSTMRYVATQDADEGGETHACIADDGYQTRGLTFEEFRDSDEWELAMSAWDGGETDSSWMSARAFIDYTEDGENRVCTCLRVSDTDERGPVAGSEVLTMDVHYDVGDVIVTLGGRSWAGTASQMMDDLLLARELHERGICMRDGALVVPVWP